MMAALQQGWMRLSKPLSTHSRAAWTRFTLLSKLVQRSPHVLIIPCLLFVIMTGLGVYGVLRAREDEVMAARGTAGVDADSASQALQLAIQRAVLPLNQITEIVKLLPEKGPLEKNWLLNAPAWWLGASAGSLFLSCLPMGLTSLVYPPNNTFNARSLGINVLTLPGIRPSTLRILEDKKMSMQGPALIAAGTVYLATIQQPIYISNVTEDQNWGYAFNKSDCPPGLCWDPATNTKWWGFASIGLDAYVFLGANGPLNSLARKGYRFQLWHPPVAGVNPMNVSKVPMIATEETNQNVDPVVVQVPVVNQMWELHVWKDSWAPAWMLPLIAAVVIGAFVVSALLFSTLSSWEEHRALLHSLLPKETIARMRNEAKWAADEQDDALKTIRLETPAELMLRIIDDCIGGRSPDLPLLLSVRDALHRSADVYRPNEQQMRDRMEEVAGLDDEVRKALFHQLLGTYNTMHHRISQAFDTGRDSNSDATDHTSGRTLRPLVARHSMVESLPSEDALDMVFKAVRFASAAQASASDQALPKLAAAPSKSFLRSQSSDVKRLLAHAPACGAVMKSLNEEVGTVLASWVLQSPTVLSQVGHTDRRLPSSKLSSMSGAGQGVPKAGRKFGSSSDNGSGHLTLIMGTCTEDVCGSSQTAPGDSEASGYKKSFSASHIKAEPQIIIACDIPDDNPFLNEPIMTVMKPIFTQLERVLVSAGEWSFDAYALDEASHGRPLSCLGFWLLHSTGIKTWARMNTKRLARFLERVEEGYANNPYHNRRHAADVLQSVHVLMHKAGLVPGFADQLTLLGCYLAAIVHDFEHVGRTNDFLVNSSDDLAVRYNDRSPMENHHLAAAWALLKAKDCNILSGLSRAESVKLRKLVIDLVLATDMKQHFAIVGQFETMKRQGEDCTDTSSASAAHERESRLASRHISEAKMDNHTKQKPVNDQDQLLSLQMMLKCADIGHIAAPLEVHLRWVSALEAEFFLQGDEEKALALPISPLCDRNKEGVTKSQIGFFDFVVLPLFKTFSQRFTGASPMMQSVQDNFAYWRAAQVQKDT